MNRSLCLALALGALAAPPVLADEPTASDALLQRIDPSHDDWEVELFARQAKTQLERLARWMGPGGLRPDGLVGHA